jgi:hypothetical protein
MNRFIVHPFVWHDDIRTNHGIVFTHPRSFFTVGRLLSGADWGSFAGTNGKQTFV